MEQLDNTFAALAHETRREILQRLMTGETTLSDLAEPYAMSQTAVSKHVKVLSEAGLVTVEQRGRTRHCRLNAEPLKEALGFIKDYEVFWQTQFDQLGAYLRDGEDE